MPESTISVEAVKPKGPKSKGDMLDVIGAYVIGGAFLVILGAISFYYDPRGNPNAMIFLSGVVGAAFGWAGGILLTPYDARDGKAFQTVFGLITGYVVAKLDPAITALLTKAIDAGVTPLAATQTAVGVTCFVVAASVTFVSRAYWQA